MAARLGSCFMLAFLNLMPFVGVWLETWPGADAVWAGIAIDVFDLRRDVVQLVGAAVLFFFASGEHRSVCVHHDAVDVMTLRTGG